MYFHRSIIRVSFSDHHHSSPQSPSRTKSEHLDICRIDDYKRSYMAHFAIQKKIKPRTTRMNIAGYTTQTTEPNQALEPTTLSVTICAPSRTDRAS